MEKIMSCRVGSKVIETVVNCFLICRTPTFPDLAKHLFDHHKELDLPANEKEVRSVLKKILSALIKNENVIKVDSQNGDAARYFLTRFS